MIVNPIDENKKRLEEQAKKESKALDERMRLQKQQAQKLKVDAKKRELDEVKRKVALKTSEKNGLVLALNDLKNKERAAKQSVKNSGGAKTNETEILNKKQDKGKIKREIEQFEAGTEQKKRSGTLKITQKQYEINTKKKELDKLKQQMALITTELDKLAQELSSLKNQEPGGAPIKDQELVKKINQEKELEREIEELERSKNLSQSQTDSAKRMGEGLKRQIEGEEKRLAAAEQELQKLTAEQTRLEQEIRGL